MISLKRGKKKTHVWIYKYFYVSILYYINICGVAYFAMRTVFERLTSSGHGDGECQRKRSFIMRIKTRTQKKPL